MPQSSSRVHIPFTGHLADGNALLRHTAEQAAWIWHPDKSARETAVLRFRLPFIVQEETLALLHVTADQRFQLRCDGRDVSFGPDRCDLEHWTVQSVEFLLTAGEHELEALVWYIAEPEGTASRSTAEPQALFPTPPMAQMTWRGGFLLHADRELMSLLSTGTASWVVEDLTDAVGMNRPTLRHYNDVGPSFAFDLARWFPKGAELATVVVPALVPNHYGVRRPGWCLTSANLPEQRREAWTGGRIRAFRASVHEGPICPEEMLSPIRAVWQALLTKGAAVTIPPHSQWTILWDTETYVCGYPLMKAEGGEGSVLEWSWAEALYQESNLERVDEKSSKGHRDEIEGKIFLGLEDRWRIGPERSTETPALWWRSGRYIRLRLKTAEAPLVLNYLGVITTGYPLDLQGRWMSSDPSWDRLMPLFERSYRSAAHEHWTDSPYYEQLCYVGDNLLHALGNYAWFGDARLSRRSIELFEWSRRASGLISERYPSSWRQESSTYSLLWPLMVRNYAWWRDDVAFTKVMLPGLRSVLAEFDGLAHADGLLHEVPGWSFVDWVPEWDNGYAPGVREGDSSVVNLLWVLALQASAQVEEAYGDPVLSQRCLQTARRVFARVLDRFWDADRALLLDTKSPGCASEHAQMFALLTGLLEEKKSHACLAALRKREGLAVATISASFFLLDALYLHREEAEFHRRLDFWRTLPDHGFIVTPEGPEPSRSDCHAWGAHPAWHTLASIAGIRPAAPGFARVTIAPLPGPLDHFRARMVHPRGLIDVDFQRQKNEPSRFRVSLPAGVAGNLVFGGRSYDLHSGTNEVGSHL
jgi:alpha-L-rhamnosidase